LAVAALVRAAFRQVVTGGAVDEPWEDGRAALAVDERQAPILAWIDALPPAGRGELRAEVERQVGDLVRRWPGLRSAWLPRTRVPMRTVVGGLAEVALRVDLVVGRPPSDRSSVALVGITAGAVRPRHVLDRRIAAVLEAARSEAPPFAVATYSTRNGLLDLEPVTAPLLVATASWMADVVGGRDRDGDRCPACVLPGSGRDGAAAAPSAGADR
jgi:hypothetical protein